MLNIAIIGIGLIGSSIARYIRSTNKEVVINIVDNSQLALEKSKKLNLGNNYFENMSECKDENEIIFICTPISGYKLIFEELQIAHIFIFFFKFLLEDELELLSLKI